MKLAHSSRYVAIALLTLLILSSGLPATPGVLAQAGTWHVATNGSDIIGDGSAASPFATIQRGIDAASHGDTVLVQPGVYRENIDFNGKNITVGSLFITTGDEDYILQTVIDGNHNGRVVTFVSGEAATAKLTGFTITNGYAHGAAEPETYGGGIYTRFSDPTLTHLRITGNEAVESGGGLHFRDSSPTVRNIIVTDNHAAGGGGGIRYTGGSVNLESAVVAHNSANSDGAGMHFYHADGAIKNTLIADNLGGGKGGGLVFDGCSPTFTNVTIAGNRTTGHGGGLHVSYFSHPALVNSIVWGNTPEQIYFDTQWPGEAVTIEYSDIQGGEAGIITNGQGPVYWGAGNLAALPRFVHAGLGNYRLADDSPAIGAGRIADAPSTDLEGNSRPDPAGSNPDMGAYENPRSSPDLPSAVTFTRITNGDIVNEGGHSSGACWGDYDNDGYVDLFVTNWEGQNNYLYHNKGDGTFEKITSGRIVNDGGWSRSCTWGDYDNDGFLDLAVSDDGAGIFLYHNEAGVAFTRVLDTPVAQDYGNCYGISWADYDNDGWLDLFVARHTDDNELLYHNRGDGTFEKITSGAIVNDGGASASVSWGDYDADGCTDLFVGNVNDQPNRLYHNNCNGTFESITTGPIAADRGFTTTSNWVDYDNDGDLDLFVGNASSDGHQDNFLYQNDGDGAFTRITTGVIVTDGDALTSSWADYDSDGDMDLFTGPSNRLQDHQRLYQNKGDGTFVRVDAGAIVEDIGASGGLWGDYDNDGDLDLFVANEEIGQHNTLYRNDGTANHWLHLKLVGAAPEGAHAGVGTNQSAIGARVTVAATINGRIVRQMQEVSGQTGMYSQNSLLLEFGLGDATVVSSVTIRWPSGAVQTMRSIAADQLLTVRETASIVKTYLPFISTSTAGSPLRVAVAMPSAITDRSFSQSMWAALKSIQAEMGGESAIELKYSENMFKVTDARAALRNYASQGFDIVIGHGMQYGASIQEIAPDFPNTVFAWGADSSTFALPNVYAYTMTAEQGGYVNGVMAAMLSRSKTLGFIGPVEVGDAKSYINGFVQGVSSADPTIRVAKTWTGSYSDVALMHEAAMTHIAAGADVLTGSSQSVVGAIAAAREQGNVLWFGTQHDQAPLAPQIVVASQQYDWTNTLRQIIANHENGMLGGDTFVLTLKNGGLKIIYNPGYNLPAEVRAAAEQAIEGIKNGTIIVEP